MRAILLLAPCILVASCSGEAPAPEQSGIAGADPLATPAALPPQASDYPALQSTECSEVAGFYFDAIAARDFARAALVWDDPVVDAARLEALFSGYREPKFAPGEAFEEGAAGSLYCTISGGLTDGADPDRALRQGTLTLRRANDVPGATPDQLRWTIQESTFVESMERAGRGEPA